jgi:hypothetical protein
MRKVWPVLWLFACDDSWKEPVAERYALLCEYQAACAESVEGLDCDAYEAQLEVNPDPCMTYDAFYIEPCLEQLRELVDELQFDPEACGTSPDDRAPACTQAFVKAVGGRCSG